jgi:hypothetical protein
MTVDERVRDVGLHLMSYTIQLKYWAALPERDRAMFLRDQPDDPVAGAFVCLCGARYIASLVTGRSIEFRIDLCSTTLDQLAELVDGVYYISLQMDIECHEFVMYLSHQHDAVDRHCLIYNSYGGSKRFYTRSSSYADWLSCLRCLVSGQPFDLSICQQLWGFPSKLTDSTYRDRTVQLQNLRYARLL